jgi:trehalose synthase-fused probable maltokinase
MMADDATVASRLAASLPATRWFAEKSATIEGVTLTDRVALPGDAAVDLVMADVSVQGSQQPRGYVVAIGPQGDDATGTPAFGRWLLDMVLSGGSLAAGRGTFVGHPSGGVERASAVIPSAAVTVSQIGGDASNTSLQVRSGSTGWIIKLLRRRRPGIQPEVEIGEFFAAASPWQETPRLCGWLEYATTDDRLTGESTAIATVHEFAPGHTTGWDRLVELLTGGGGLAGHSGDEVLAIVAALGQTTGRMHRALAARPDLPAFAVEPAEAAGRWAAAKRMREHAAGVCVTLQSRLPQLEPSIARRLTAVLAARSSLLNRFDELATLALPTANIRVHGDYHLGQVLLPERDSRLRLPDRDIKPLVIDFEGEPGRTLAERRAKTAAAKDVAGMCRSFDYLLRHVAKSTDRPYAAADLERLESCFLDAYRGVAGGQAWWPADDKAAGMLISVFKLDKAIYELAYELDNRPDWIDVPLSAIEEAVARGTSDDRSRTE